MEIISDTRQKAGKHKAKEEYFAACGDNITRCKLPFGDYSLMYSRSVDTKEDIYELAQDINNDHQRFKREIVGAMNAGCVLFILVENEDGVRCLDDLERWSESTDHFQMRLRKNVNAKPIKGATLAKACRTMSQRYGVRFYFCTPKASGECVRKLLKDGVLDG